MIEVFDLSAKSLMLNWGELLVVTIPQDHMHHHTVKQVHTKNQNLHFSKLTTQDVCHALAFLLYSLSPCTGLYHPLSLIIFPIACSSMK